MQTLIVNVNDAKHAVYLANFLKTLPYIQSVITEKNTTSLKPLTAADWVRPGRPATDEEIEQMLDECEKGIAISAEKSKKNNLKKFRVWKQRTLK